jgi:methionyl-tRNA formyltransferase
MKLILFSGTHPRHLFINQELLKHFDETLVVLMEREELLPKPDAKLLSHDKELFIKHFRNRYVVETNTYGNLDAQKVYAGCQTINVKPNELNTDDIAAAVRKFNADFCFIFGTGLILDPVINELPEDKINMHLGLSPWYKGGATLYWPFYHLQPQFCGVTFHQITKEADAGEIIHQCVPNLEKADKIHDVGAKCLLKAQQDLPQIIIHWKENRKFKGKIQKTFGRNWRTVDFHASQLRVIYDLFNDNIVDEYLAGNLKMNQPKLFSCIN